MASGETNEFASRGSRFRRLSSCLKQRFSERIYQVSVHVELSCPNRDGTLEGQGCAFCLDEALEPLDGGTAVDG